MSNPLENKSQNSSSEEVELTGPKEMVVDYQSPALHSELARIIKRMVSQSIASAKLPTQDQMSDTSNQKALVAVPISISRSRELDANVATPGTAARKRSRMTRSTVVEERSVTFELPKDCIVDQIDMDRLPYVEGKNIPVAVPVRRLSFSERLEGWSIERRQRPNKTYDVFYLHPKSSRMFRSITEVVKFLLYEIYPNYTRKENRLMLVENLDKDMTSEAPKLKRICMSTSSGDHRREQEKARKIVEKFLEDAYNNLMNSGSKRLAENTMNGLNRI